jgi:hypothetical protein
VRQREHVAWAFLKFPRLLCVPMQKLIHAHSLAHTHVLAGGKQAAKYTNRAIQSGFGPRGEGGEGKSQFGPRWGV